MCLDTVIYLKNTRGASITGYQLADDAALLASTAEATTNALQVFRVNLVCQR